MVIEIEYINKEKRTIENAVEIWSTQEFRTGETIIRITKERGGGKENVNCGSLENIRRIKKDGKTIYRGIMKELYGR